MSEPTVRASFQAADLGAASVLLAAVPFLNAHIQGPNVTMLSQLAAIASWGLVLVFCPARLASWRNNLSPPVLAATLWLVAQLLAPLLSGLPWSLAFSAATLLLAFVALFLLGQGLDTGQRERWWAWTCRALVLAGVFNVFVALVQVFWPESADGNWIARSGLPGRAVGNMRQPNHLATLLMWSSIAAVYLSERRAGGGLRRTLLLPVLLSSFMLAIVLSASRTGMLAVAMLVSWAVIDRTLSKRSRLSLWATPLMLVLSWALMSYWAHSQQHVFGAESRLSEGAGSPSRIAVLSNALDLLRQNPWTGIGAGEFNLAWTMTPFPDRPVAFFDHTHNLPMQVLVELGLPLGATILLLLCWGLWRAWKHCAALDGDAARCARSALMVVLMAGLHSLLEYPLWYSYFLLPTAMAFAVCSPSTVQSGEGQSDNADWAKLGAVLICGTLYAAWDYNKAVVIYDPPANNAGSLEERIKIGQRSLLFSHMADYAAATNYPPGPEALAAAKRTAHNLIDARLMMAWARSLHATGDTDRARYVVARLREFRNAAAQEWLDECLGLVPGQVAPFQCEPPKRDYSFREMR